MAEVHTARISENIDSTSSPGCEQQFRSNEINGPGTEVSEHDHPTPDDVKSKVAKFCVSGEGRSRIIDETTENDGNVLVNGCTGDNSTVEGEHKREDHVLIVNSEPYLKRSYLKEDITIEMGDDDHNYDDDGDVEYGCELQHSCCDHHTQYTAHRTVQPNQPDTQTDLTEDMSCLSLEGASTGVRKCIALGVRDTTTGITYVGYGSETQMPDIMRLITKDLSEPYSIYTYRYFIHNWPDLCFLAMDEEKCVGSIVCKLDVHKKMAKRGYIAMLAVDEKYRRKQIGSSLVRQAIYAMIQGNCDEVVLETEITNKAALQLYENLGFVRDKRLFRYYLNGVDALRLKLWLR